jgi:PAS domain S-box-containing protein
MSDDDRDIYRIFFENTGVGLFETTVDGRFVRANPAAAHSLGYATPAEMMAAITDIRHQVYVNPAARDAMLRDLQEKGRVENHVHEVRRRDGSNLWVSMTINLLRDETGAPHRLIGSTTEVSELIATQQALRQAEENYRGIFEHATEGIYWSTLDGRQLRANPALVRLNGYASEAEMLPAVNDIATEWYVDPRRRGEFSRLMARDGFVENFESEVFRHKTRERIWISENARLVHNPDGSPSHYEGTVRDITAAKRAEAALKEAIVKACSANEAKSAFLANMSHELRTPLNAILGFCELMLLETLGPLGHERYNGYLKDIHFSANHLLQLIEDVLDLSKAEAHRVDLDEQPVDVEATAAAAVRLLAERARRGGVHIELAAAADLPAIRADERRLRQVLLNLLSNAVKFTPAGGTVRLAAERTPAGGILLSVSDTGIGIAPEDLARVFQPFVQLDRERRQEGTGLGLVLCKKLVELHDGTIALNSRVGAGTTVEIRLPHARVYPDTVTPAVSPEALAALLSR